MKPTPSVFLGGPFTGWRDEFVSARSFDSQVRAILSEKPLELDALCLELDSHWTYRGDWQIPTGDEAWEAGWDFAYTRERVEKARWSWIAQSDIVLFRLDWTHHMLLQLGLALGIPGKLVYVTSPDPVIGGWAHAASALGATLWSGTVRDALKDGLRRWHERTAL